jgi:hypothetical protein
MKNLTLAISILAAFFCAKGLCAQAAKDLSKACKTVSVPYSVPDNDKRNFADVYFSFGWNDKKPYTISVQFVNHGYANRKIKFAIKDVTAKKMVVVDRSHNARFGTETVKANSKGAIWSGTVEDIKDSFSLHVWDSEGNEFDKVAVSISDQQ